MPARTHGRYLSREYRSWDKAKQRCTNPKNQRYFDYGGRGIRMCPAWLNSFAAFHEYLGPRPEGHTLDRINNDGNYEPGNVRWATRKQQYSNQRHTRRITWGGRTQTLNEWAAEFGLSRDTLDSRIERGWPLDRAMTARKFEFTRTARAEVPASR